MERIYSAQVLQTILGQCSAIFIISLIPFYIKEAHKTEGAHIYDIWNKSSPQSKTTHSFHGEALVRLLCRLHWPLAQD